MNIKNLFNEQMERAVLGALVVDGYEKKYSEEVFSILTPEDFYDTRHQIIFRTIENLHAERVKIDAVVLLDRLQSKNMLEQIGGAQALADLFEAPGAANLVYYAKSVKRDSIHRKLLRTIESHHQELLAPMADVDELMRNLENELAAIRDSGIRDHEPSFLAVCAQAAEGVLNGPDETSQGLLTGFTRYDENYGGLWPGQLVVIAGRPSMGKSAMMLSLAHNVLRDGKGVLLFSLEMAKNAELAKRFMALYTEIPFYQLRDRRIYVTDGIGKLGTFINEIGSMNLHIIDDPRQCGNADRLSSVARQYQQKHQIDLIAIDYLQLMEARGKENKNVEISFITRQLKLLARELNIPVVLLSQLNRALESREDKIPRLSDLRDSGSIEQDADAVILLHRQDYYNHGRPGYVENHKIKLHIAKQRNGEPGVLEMNWAPDIMRVKN